MADETSTPTSEQTAEQPTEATTETVAAEATAETIAADETTALGGEAEVEGAETEAAPEVPETYELAAPEGFESLNAKAIEIATPVFKELGLNNEQANKLMPVAGEFAKQIVEERDQQFLGQIAEQRKTWLEDARKDTEIGGANWDSSLAAGAKALDQLGFPKGSPLRNLLNESGLGNHPEMIRFAAKVGKAIGEDGFERPLHSGNTKKTDAEIFYPKSNGQ